MVLVDSDIDAAPFLRFLDAEHIEHRDGTSLTRSLRAFIDRFDAVLILVTSTVLATSRLVYVRSAGLRCPIGMLVRDLTEPVGAELNAFEVDVLGPWPASRARTRMFIDRLSQTGRLRAPVARLTLDTSVLSVAFVVASSEARIAAR